MELNGVANIKMILESAKMKEDSHKLDPKVVSDIEQQCDLLERYMLACHQAFLSLKNYPHWHEVRENPEKYPTLKEVLKDVGNE